jgi:chromosome segregation protein
VTAARLTALRLVGFKSFAERTEIQFGPGISAVVGPNGSGKSNLADALRWTLGEQGRGLRTRRAEDVIFAGSSSRKAIGMADVTLVVDNSDRLLPVDYAEVEIGRRLYRSGENEYLLNRQRIRLRDLVELLDAGNLADNAFLFIGQGMVDQALALRPEERRPLFEEAAGVRRHERRRRQAEHELAESEANLERLRDLLGELRPQARRLAAQAEQLQARQTAGLELAEALLAAARTRWLSASETERREAGTLTAAHTTADAALADLRRAEEEAAATSAQMATHADEERARRAVVEKHQAEIVDLRVAQARLHSELAGVERESERIAAERATAEERLRDAGRVSSVPQPQADQALAAELESVERALTEASGATDGSARGASSEDALAREVAALRKQHATQAGRATEVAATLQTASAQIDRLTARLAEADAERDAAVAGLGAIVERESAAQADLETARARLTDAAAAADQAEERVRQLDTEHRSASASLAALEAALGATADESLARAARARGGRLVAEGLEVDARFRNAVSAALDHAAGGFVVDDPSPLLAAKRHGTLVVRGGTGRRRTPVTASGAPVLAAAHEFGGGRLLDAIRRDPHAEVTRLLERVVWVPDLGLALRLAPSLQPGWRAVTIAGDLVSDEGVIVLASEHGVLEQRAERDGLRRRTSDLETQLASASDELRDLRQAAESAATEVRRTQQRVEEARVDRRPAEERERVAQRRAEQWLREQTWETSQKERLVAEAASAAELAQRTATELQALEERARIAQSTKSVAVPGAAEAAARLSSLRSRREELAVRRSTESERLATWQEEQRRAEIGRQIDETRLSDLDRQHSRASERQAQLSTESSELGDRLSAAQLQHSAAAKELEAVLAAGADDRTRLMESERAATDARERLRVAEQQTRRSEIAQMEARLQLDQVREQLLVELAGIGNDGLLALQRAAGMPDVGEVETVGTGAFETTLETVVRSWETATGAGLEAPTTSRLGSLRRRYHELGAGNPFAVEEYSELRERLETMEAQRADLESAIESTRELIATLSAMITEQFRKTFAALEDSFARQFQELFGGGDAQLSLTAPDDLSATGVEIHARPPGKKRQPLSMLSGGERALTAVSLLLAMLEVRPVPFCVLDEVDAALDEANIGRFSKALRGLAEQTQFIVITHNRGTIEAADTLYGVTIGDDAVSRIVSLRLPKSISNGDAGPGLVADAEVALA